MSTASEPFLIAELLSAAGFVDLTDPELAHLVLHGLPLPYTRRKITPADADSSVLAAMIARGLADRSDGPSSELLSLWRLVAPVDVLVLVDCFTTGGDFCWTYSLAADGFSELTEADNGGTWLFGAHEQLLARVLVAAGVGWHASEGPLAGADPLRHEERTRTMISRVERGPAAEPRSSTVEIEFIRGATAMVLAGAETRAHRVVEEVVAVLTGGAVAPA